MRTTATSTLDSAANVLRLMRLIGAKGSITLAEAAIQLGVSKSTAHRLLMTLLAQDYATRDPAGRRYYAGQNAVSAGLSTLWDFDIRQRTTAPLLRLAESIGETVKLLVLDGPYARVLDVAETVRSLHVGSSLGKLLPANATAGGKMLLSPHGEDSLRHRFGDRLPALTDHTIDDWDYLAVELQAIRKRGWALSEGESTPHVNGIAVPVVGAGGWIIGALAVAAPEGRLTRARHVEILDQLMHVARQLGRVMGGTAERSNPISASASTNRRAG
ncbi:IclR family transcriptional regulator [Microbacterium sp. CPCC 204701]|uniref:IclR family transcriptional regulator n=1 Tax=Microbacterium sp. CPCC 204701 TaxID=2493084 RepID=UPI0013E2C1EB|nr:IclR family transcriptional regulator [Microbacterium sp. CPCC 204701]